MTKDEFEKGYAERSGVTVDWLHDHGQFGAPCDCGESGCRGWQMKRGGTPNKSLKTDRPKDRPTA